ncbi:MAG: NUDIX domain-containing protein [Ruminococcaceae bacterium]|nr:NUDIX domain-containing protein [Oscillospiraceae bacterium]
MLELSCGTVPFKIKDNTVYYLLIEGKPFGYVGFPKGHMEAGETEEETAIRETYEETSITANIIDGFKGHTHYRLSNGNEKKVVYFLCDFSGQTPKHNESFEDFYYHIKPFDKAYSALRFESDRAVLKAADEYIRKNILK